MITLVYLTDNSLFIGVFVLCISHFYVLYVLMRIIFFLFATPAQQVAKLGTNKVPEVEDVPETSRHEVFYLFKLCY